MFNVSRYFPKILAFSFPLQFNWDFFTSLLFFNLNIIISFSVRIWNSYSSKLSTPTITMNVISHHWKTVDALTWVSLIFYILSAHRRQIWIYYNINVVVDTGILSWVLEDFFWLSQEPNHNLLPSPNRNIFEWTSKMTRRFSFIHPSIHPNRNENIDRMEVAVEVTR